MTVSLAYHCLVAMPALDGTPFERSVVLICHHGQEGAGGVILNQRLEITLADLLMQLEMSVAAGFSKQTQLIFFGGPVNPESGFLLHTGLQKYAGSARIQEGLFLTASIDVLKAIAQKEGPPESMIFLGCSRWSPGQLEKEISAHDWLVIPASMDLIFDIPLEKRWAKAAQRAGIANPHQLVNAVGHG